MLSEYRLVYVAPASGIGGVGDYADNFVDAVRPHFKDVVEYRHPGPGADTQAQIRLHRKNIRALVDSAPNGKVLVHAEVSGGSVASFWGTAGIHDVPVSFTVHDPPGMVWWPARTKFIAERKVLNHALHYPLKPLIHRVERKVVGTRTLFALTKAGAASLKERYPDADVKTTVHFVSTRPDIAPAETRPMAVGLFGMVYRGKGFEQIDAIRAQLPDDITIRIAGRGTEVLPSAPGIEILGEVNGADEDAFFESVRALLVPYGSRSSYGAAFPASGVVTRAIAYQTPLVCLAYGSLTETEEDGGAIAVDGTATDMADVAASLVTDPAHLEKLRREVDELRTARTPANVALDFVNSWAATVSAR